MEVKVKHHEKELGVSGLINAKLWSFTTIFLRFHKIKMIYHCIVLLGWSYNVGATLDRDANKLETTLIINGKQKINEKKSHQKRISLKRPPFWWAGSTLPTHHESIIWSNIGEAWNKIFQIEDPSIWFPSYNIHSSA